MVESIVIRQSASSLEADFDPEISEIPDDRNGATWLSNDFLAQAGLRNIELYATKSITTEGGTSISLQAGGRFTAQARSILHQGAVSIPAGEIEISAVDNYTTDRILYYEDGYPDNPDYISQEDLGSAARVELASGSTINAAGERINDYGKKQISATYTQMDGGEVLIEDLTQDGDGVVIQSGASINVGGGYQYDTKGKLVDAGDAGSIEIRGGNILLDGEISAKSMIGHDGGSITLHTGNIRVESNHQAEPLPEGYSSGDALPADRTGTLVIDDNRFDDTGVTRINLLTLSNLTIGKDVSLKPSTIKLISTDLGKTGERAVDLSLIGDSGIKLKAGTAENYDNSIGNENAKISVDETASLTVAPQGDISISAVTADISGRYTAHGGTITISTKSTLESLPLIIRSGAYFDLSGLALDSGEQVNNKIIWDLLDGGDFTISSPGTLVMEEGSRVDVSGSGAVTQFRATQNTNRLKAYLAASTPGSVTLSFTRSLDADDKSTIQTEFIADKSLNSLYGGSFYLTQNGISSDFILQADLVDNIEQNGFDFLEVTSASSILFDESQEINMGRGIVLDTPLIKSGQNANILLNSPWIQLQNSGDLFDASDTTLSGTLTLNAGFIDITGRIQTQGFADISICTTDDIRLSDSYYKSALTNFIGWAGLFSTQGDLTLTASRIYPTTASVFTLSAGGTITTANSGVTREDSIYSALGSLTLEATSINHGGYIAAPNGQIYLDAQERIYLAPGSVLSVSSDLAVSYGIVDDTNLNWYGYDKTSEISLPDFEITELAEKGIAISGLDGDTEGLTFIGSEDAVIDIRGGGTVYGYTFLRGNDGSLNPIATSESGSYVIVPGAMGNLPGEAVYFEGNELLAQGIYTLLPESYAFLPGAVVVESLGTLDPGTYRTTSNEGYSLAVGYDADAGSGLHSTRAELYTIRLASDVLEEGQFEFVGVETGNAGTLTIDAATNIFNAALFSSALDETYRSGIVNLSGADVIVGATRADLGSDFSFETRLEDDADLSELIGRLYLSAEQLSNADLWGINIGSLSTTKTITFDENSKLTATHITLTAQQDIRLKENAGIEGNSDVSIVSVFSNNGRLIMEAGSAIQSDYMVAIDAAGLERGGQITAGAILSLASENLYFSDHTHEENFTDLIPAGETEWMMIDEAFWSSFSSLDGLWLSGRNTIGFAGTIALETASIISTDTPLLANLFSGEESSSIQLSAAEIYFENSDSTAAGSDDFSGGAGTFSVGADTESIYIGNGDIAFSGFETINLSTSGDLTFLGAGSLTTNDSDLTLTAARVTGHYAWVYNNRSEEYDYMPVDFEVNAGDGKITILSSGGTTSKNGNIGGQLSFVAGTIDLSGTLDLGSGYIHLNATGSGAEQGIFLRSGAVISAAETSDSDGNTYDAGLVYLESEQGTITLEENSLVDVSATQADAGTIEIYNPGGDFSANGTLKGSSVSGLGGSAILDVHDLGDLSALISHLSENGFNEQLSIRLRDQTLVTLLTDVSAAEFRLSSDTGSIKIDADISADGLESGGLVEIYAGQDLSLSDASSITARGTGADASGGEVILASGISKKGTLDLGGQNQNGVRTPGASIDVSGNGGQDGSVYLKAARNAADSEINLTGAPTIIGAAEVMVEGTKIYTEEDGVIEYSFSGWPIPYDTDDWYNDTQAFMTEYGSDIKARLIQDLGISADLLTFAPGIEIQSDGDLTVAVNYAYPYYADVFDLTPSAATGRSWWRFGEDETAAVLTLKAAGNLTINSSITDAPTYMEGGELISDTAQKTTTINLAAGASLTSSDIFAVKKGSGTLTVADKVRIYTEGGDINFASGDNTVIGKINDSLSDYMLNLLRTKYTIGSFTGRIRGQTGGNLNLNGGIIQTATGDIDLVVGNQLNLGTADGVLGSIRTTGEPRSSEETGWSYVKCLTTGIDGFHSGGNINIFARNSVQVVAPYSTYSDISYLNFDAWYDQVRDYDYSGEAPVSISKYGWAARYDGSDTTQGIATMAGGDVSISTWGNFSGQVGTFGAGDLTLFANQDINGRFLNYDGALHLTGYGSFGTLTDDQVIEIFNTDLSMNIQGSITLASILNPTIASKAEGAYFATNRLWIMGYTEDTSASLTATNGSITLTGDVDTQYFSSARSSILPATVTLSAGEDINIQSSYYMTPSSTGQLELIAGGDINGKNTVDTAADSIIIMSDMNPDEIYTNIILTSGEIDTLTDLANSNLHADTLLHEADEESILIQAGGSIYNIDLYLAKSVNMTAGEDIANIYLKTQNISLTDQTTIMAGGDIYFETELNDQGTTKGIEIYGPGMTVVLAGNTIDLGTSDGISTLGSGTNSWLPDDANDLILIAGLPIQDISTTELDLFFIGDSEILDLADLYEETGDISIFEGNAELMTTVLDYLAGEGFVAGIDGLRQAGTKWTQAKADGDDALVQQIMADVRQFLIDPMFSESDGLEGTISLVNSRVLTKGNSGGIYTIAKGEINVGLSAVQPPPITGEAASSNTNSGFYTAGGGFIRMYAGSDINVNESRIMTFSGGDIDIFSNTGNVNAGRGSKAAVASSSVYYELQTDGTYKEIYEPPAVGSGIRATAPDIDIAGDIYVTALEGDIDAGEAGIAGRNVTLAAERVLNAQNIQTSGIAIGFTQASESSGSIGGLSGGGGLSDSTFSAEETSSLASARERFNEPLPEGFSVEPRWVDVEVIGFQDDDDEDKEKRKNKQTKRANPV